MPIPLDSVGHAKVQLKKSIFNINYYIHYIYAKYRTPYLDEATPINSAENDYVVALAILHGPYVEGKYRWTVITLSFIYPRLIAKERRKARTVSVHESGADAMTGTPLIMFSNVLFSSLYSWKCLEKAAR